jgi:hypothetical protein
MVWRERGGLPEGRATGYRRRCRRETAHLSPLRMRVVKGPARVREGAPSRFSSHRHALSACAWSTARLALPRHSGYLMLMFPPSRRWTPES